MSRFQRFVASQIIWLLTITGLFLNLDYLRFSNQAFLIIGFVLGFAVLLNIAVWFGEGIAKAFDDEHYENTISDSESDSIEKRKRERIDQVLRDLTNEDLYLLQERLQNGAIDDELLYEHMVGDDGELVRRN